MINFIVTLSFVLMLANLFLFNSVIFYYGHIIKDMKGLLKYYFNSKIDLAYFIIMNITLLFVTISMLLDPSNYYIITSLIFIISIVINVMNVGNITENYLSLRDMDDRMTIVLDM